MTTAVESASLDGVEIQERRLSVVRSILSSTEGRIGCAMLAASVLLIVVGPLVARPTMLGSAAAALGPSSAHPLGTDALGRDVLSRVLTGGRTVLLIPLAAVSLAGLIGGSIGLASAYVGGWVDNVVTRAFDLMYAVPPLLIVLVVLAALGPSTSVIVITVALAFSPAFGRVVRASTQAVVVNPYVAAAKARGERGGAIVFREILPNVVAPVLAEFGLEVTYAILFVAGLSFLGLGVQPPRADWGLMVSENRDILPVAPLACLAPAFAITVLAVSFNLIADALAKTLTAEARSHITLV
jgi:peptide/nickel transport system permease protein